MNGLKKLVGVLCIALGLIAEYYLITTINSGSLFKTDEENKIFALTVIMCVVSGGFAIRRLVTSDPAELFA